MSAKSGHAAKFRTEFKIKKKKQYVINSQWRRKVHELGHALSIDVSE